MWSRQKEGDSMKAARAHGPLDPSPRDREAALARRWRHLRDGVPSALFLVACALALLAVLVLLGYVLTRVANDDALGQADSSLSRWFAARRSKDLNEVTRWTSSAGGTLPVAVMAVLVVAGAALVWRRWREPLLVAVAVTGEVAIFLGVTMLVDRSRPPVQHLDEAPPTSSFPSGHAAAAVVLYGAVAILASERVRSAALRRLLVALAVLIPLVVAVSRVYRGMHYISDVVAGLLLGATWLFVALRGIRLGVLHHQLRAHDPGRRRRSASAMARGESTR
jgi:membrane-associated phospholipid phosphatase